MNRFQSFINGGFVFQQKKIKINYLLNLLNVQNIGTRVILFLHQWKAFWCDTWTSDQ